MTTMTITVPAFQRKKLIDELSHLPCFFYCHGSIRTISAIPNMVFIVHVNSKDVEEIIVNLEKELNNVIFLFVPFSKKRKAKKNLKRLQKKFDNFKFEKFSHHWYVTDYGLNLDIIFAITTSNKEAASSVLLFQNYISNSRYCE